jgi:hypothetical protein
MRRARTVLESDALRVTVDPLVGGTIAAIAHKRLGASVLGRVPWETEASLPESYAAPDERSWLRHYEGGWPVLFPNGGDACRFAGVFHGFHGEASLAPWEAEMDGLQIHLRRKFDSVPVEMHRAIEVTGEIVTIRETVRMLGADPVQVMWGHHPSFGSDLLDGPFEIQTGARHVSIDDRYDGAANPLQHGTTCRWPMAAGKRGAFDLSRPSMPMAGMAYLHDFGAHWAAIRRLDDRVAAALSWDGTAFPHAWLWLELEGTQDAPWDGKTRLIGIEPNTTWPGNGLADTAQRRAPLLTLQPGVEISATVRLHVFKPNGPVLGVDADGQALRR